VPKAAVLCRFGALEIGSSSSSLSVRSMTDDAGRLLDGLGALIAVDGSREYSEVGGVPGVLWFLIDRNLESLISIISSSPSISKSWFPLDGEGVLVLVDHFPSGSMVTWSTDRGVFVIISLT
jgi:hypothetical protein